MTAYRLDELIARGAEAIRRRYPSKQMAYGRAAGVTKSTASRHINGDAHSPATHFLRGALLVGWPLIVEGAAALNRAEIWRASTHELQARLEKLNELEHDHDANEDRQTLRAAMSPTSDQLDAAAAADVRIAEISLERAAIRRELSLRGRTNG